jgi:hypothetical protein
LTSPNYNDRQPDSTYSYIPAATSNYILFLNNFERWIEEIISRDGKIERAVVIKAVKQSFERAIQANIAYHSFMAESAKGNNEGNLVIRHELLAEIYESILNIGKKDKTN